MSTESQYSVAGGRSSSREPLTATPDPVNGAWPMTSSSSDRSKSVTSEADSVFSASSRPTNETTPEILDTESKASAVQHWATAQIPRTVTGKELASRLAAAAAGQKKHTSTSTTTAGDSLTATTAALPTMTSAISTKAESPSAAGKLSPKIPLASSTANLKEDVPHKSIIKLKRFLGPEDRDKPVKKYTTKKRASRNDDDSDPYNLPEDAESDTCPTNQLKPSKKEKKRQAEKVKLTLSSSTPATADNNSDDDEPPKKTKLTKEQRRAQKKVKPAPSPTTSTSSASVDNGSDSEYLPKPKTSSKKRKSPLPSKKEDDQPALKKPKTKVSPPSPSPSSSSPSTSPSTTPASSTTSIDHPKQLYQLRAAEIVRSPLGYDDCVRDDARPGKAARIRRVFRRFRREQGEPVSTEICGARNPPDPETEGKGDKWGAPYKPGGDGGVVVGWVKNKARRIWGGEVNRSASEYARKR